MSKRRTVEFQGFPTDLGTADTLMVRPVEPDRLAVQQYQAEARQAGRKLIVRVSRWYKPRTTGYRSQNTRIHGFAQQCLAALGWEGVTLEQFIYWMKHRARSRGFPFHVFPDGLAAPASERDCDTVDASYLIDEIEQFAAANGIRLLQYDDDGGLIRL